MLSCLFTGARLVWCCLATSTIKKEKALTALDKLISPKEVDPLQVKALCGLLATGMAH